jgi:hypothetical protein
MDIGQAIAALGVYFALMAILAIMVEAIIGVLKVPDFTKLKGNLSPNDVITEVKVWLPHDKLKAREAQIVALNKAIKEMGEIPIPEDSTLEDVVGKVGELMTKHIQDEKIRRLVIKAIAVVLGTLLAWLFDFDSLEILKGLFTGDIMDLPQWAGYILSGISASAGSHFWHDWSANLRQIKKGKEAAENLLG